MKNARLALWFAITLPFVSFAHATEGEKGNGGDFIRQIFIERGKEIVTFLEKTESKTSFLKSHGISAKALRNAYRIEVVQVSPDPLTDNGGSAVDALGSVGKILLSQPAWRAFILKGVKLDKMILHEGLRAIGKNDDNYVISEKAPELPYAYNQNTVSAGYRLIREEFADAHFPTEAELRDLVGVRLACEEYVWDDTNGSSMSALLEIWRSRALKIFWISSHGYSQAQPDVLYIDSELQSLSGLITPTVQVTVLTRTGREIIAEVTDSRDLESPTAVSNLSLRAKRYRLCEIR